MMKTPPRKPDIQVRFLVSYEVDVPIWSCDSPELYEQKVMADPKQVRDAILYFLFGGTLGPVNEEEVKIKFVKYLEHAEKEHAQELLPPTVRVRQGEDD